jgi:hypothetical protein
MTGLILRGLHVQWWIPFLVYFGLYIITASAWILNGYGQEYLGWRHPGRPGKIHRVLVRFHTGAHFHPEKSFGDERRLRSAAGGTKKATPEGTLVYFTPHSRLYRAIRNNLAVFTVLVLLSCLAFAPADTIRAIVILIFCLVMLRLAIWIIRARASYRKTHPVHAPAMAQTQVAKRVFGADAMTVGTRPILVEEEKPQLEGIPKNVLASLLASKMGCSSAEAMSLLKMSPERGELRLPDTFAALVRDRESIQEIIEAHTIGKVRFSWNTTVSPRSLAWIPVIIPKLPSMVRLRDYLPAIQALGARETGLGVRAEGSVYVQSHNGDLPWWCRFMGSGTGKSMSFMVKVAQIAHKDPAAQIYCIDTKQVSFEALHGIPGVHIFDNPVTEMDKIWDIFYKLNGILEERYTAVRERRKHLSDFGDIWIFCDEGNHLGGKLKNYWTKTLGESSASPSVWAEAIAPLLQQGRQANMFGEFMFQDLTDRAMGGQSLKFAFSAFCAAGFQPNQFIRTIGSPGEECLEGPGKILVCQGNKRTWTQGFMDDEQWLHDYALVNRKGLAA